MPNPHLDAKLLLLESASISEERFYSSPDTFLSPAREKRYYKLISKRLSGFPIPYLTRRKEFWSISFFISPGVAIPRPETELIVEKTLELVSVDKPLIVDIGTGCGNIAVSLATELPYARILAMDRSRKALKIAKLNAARQGISSMTIGLYAPRLAPGNRSSGVPRGHDPLVAGRGFMPRPRRGGRERSDRWKGECGAVPPPRLTFARGSLFSPLKRLHLDGQCDFIVSNPPYIAEEEWAKLPREIKDHEPKKALLAGASGLEVIEKLVRGAPCYLKHGGYLLVEIGHSQKESIMSFFGLDSEWEGVFFFKDLSGMDRVAAGKRK